MRDERMDRLESSFSKTHTMKPTESAAVERDSHAEDPGGAPLRTPSLRTPWISQGILSVALPPPVCTLGKSLNRRADQK